MRLTSCTRMACPFHRCVHTCWRLVAAHRGGWRLFFAGFLAARLAGRARGSDGSLEQRLKRSDAFATFRADHTITNNGSQTDAIRRLLRIIEL